ncbi:MAG: hypothetical protein C5B44_06335 [Acidobacteria bacterium]|nr:MAG: hypothetical protein C5B44_06335 [Acidobacteriota bacterium]
MNCDCTEKVSLLIDGELSSSEAREIERHLLTCAECQQARADFLSVRSELSAFPSTVPQLALRNELSKLLSPVTSPSRPVVVRRPFLGWAFGPAAAAFATLLIASAIAVWFFNISKRPDTNQPVAVATPQPAPTETAPSPTPQTPPSKEENKKEQTKEPRNAPSTPVRRPVPVSTPRPGEQFASIPEQVRPADAQTLTVMHLEKSEVLLRSFRNVRVDSRNIAEVSYEKNRAQQLVIQNMILRREAEASGDVQSATLLESLEPILLDIANLPEKPKEADVNVIKERVERKNIVPLLQVNSAALARALD